MELIDIVELVDSVTSIMEPLARKNNNKFVVDTAEDMGRVYTDVTKLRQIIINLLSNACKFTHNGEIVLHIELDDRYMLIRVTDTGIGIPADKLQELFTDFMQVDSSTTKQYGGTGLGLALCKRFTEMLGGSIKVSSQLNAGSTFSVKIPHQK